MFATKQPSFWRTISACHWPQKRRWSSWWPPPSPHDRSWSYWWSTCKRTSPLWSVKRKNTFRKGLDSLIRGSIDSEPETRVISPECSTSSRPQARWTFPQGEGDSGLLTLPVWQMFGARGWGRGICHFHSSVFSPDVHLHRCASHGSCLPPAGRECDELVWTIQMFKFHSHTVQKKNQKKHFTVMPPSTTWAAVYIQTVETSAWIHELWIKKIKNKKGGCRDLEFLIKPSLSLSKSLQVTSTLAWTFEPNLKLFPGTV